MALSAQLGSAGTTAQTIETNAAVTLEARAGWTVTEVKLDVKAKIPNADAAFQEAAENARKLSISRLLNEVSLTARPDFGGRSAEETIPPIGSGAS